MDHAPGVGSCLTVLAEMASLVSVTRVHQLTSETLSFISARLPILKHLLSESCLYAGAGVAQQRGGYEGIAELEGRGCFSV
jgi:hypothetical protein